MSIRLRLTLWYVSLLAVILLAFSVALYAILSFSLFSEVDRTIERRADEVENGITAALAVQSDPRFIFLRGIAIPSANAFVTPGVYVQLTTTDGRVISRSENLGDQRFIVPSDMLPRVASGETFFANLEVERVPLRVFVSPLTVRGQHIGVVIVAQSLQNVLDTLARLATILALGIVSGLAFAALGGAILARGALAPIDRITQTARDIARAGDLARRIETKQTRDEVGRLAATFNEMLARIEELFRAQQRFVADISHELRSPLTAIRGNLDLLRRVSVNDQPEREQALADIDSESARMQRLVNDLLFLAQADTGLSLRKETVELDTIFLEVYRHARMTAKSALVALGGEDQAQIIGDADRIKQMLLNLAENAIKYTPSGGTVTLALERDAEWVRLSIADTGQGLAPEDLPKIFERFYRVDAARTHDAAPDSGGGAGLGLSIAKSIAEAHDGRIQVESEVGKGSKFTVWLPLK